MPFYSQFADRYEQIFPFRERVHAFLRENLPIFGERVLEVGCGTGHYCGRFGEQGFRSLGIDLDEEMIRVARESHPDADFMHLDMKDLSTLPGPFDLIYCIGNTAAHIDNGSVSRLARDVASLLSPSGCWILQMVNWDRVLETGTHAFPSRNIAGNLRFHREYRDVSEASVRFLVRMEDAEHTLLAEETELYPLRAETCKKLHASAGLELVEHLGDYSGATFDASVAPASVFVFRKVDD